MNQLKTLVREGASNSRPLLGPVFSICSYFTKWPLVRNHRWTIIITYN